MAAADTAIYYRLSTDDFETASIRSAAPSYISEAPSYHSTIPPNESTPAYTPATVPHYSTINRAAPTTNTTTTTNTPRTATTTTSSSPSTTSPPPRHPTSLLPPLPTTSPAPRISTFTPGAGLPRLPSPRRAAAPSLSHFRMPTSWSSPQARHYHSVASRRVAAGGDALRSVLARANTSSATLNGGDDAASGGSGERVRPLEDPYLVGEEAAARARRERLARESGEDILISENRRWDWFLAQLKESEERDRSWTNFRREMESGSRRKLARRFGR
ncbi:hypothetical protein F4810DRAFT_708332 [Camillea tinctor]|nr:hypothetical protein F4810DRAFT_708332 [Camillea tinctor]